MKVPAFFLISFLLGASALAQNEPPAAADSLPELKEQVGLVLAQANLPFTAEQERSITLMMEDRLRSAEELFGQTMDFRQGPTQGQQVDRARDAILWLRNEFVVRLRDYLSTEQLAVWTRFTTENAAFFAGAPQAGQEGGAAVQQQTQFVRINNNAFTAESTNLRTGGAPEVIQRGGVGAYHGNVEFVAKGSRFNARNPFAQNKPPYQERETIFDISGPVIPGRLTAAISANRNEAENVDTINAVTPTGPFELGITRPSINQSINSSGTYQIADSHSLGYVVRYGTNNQRNQGVGGFNLQERASNSNGRNWGLELRQFSSLSPRSILETRLNYSSNRNATLPASGGVQYNVLDAFRSGGSQNKSEFRNQSYEFSALYTRLGENLTIKTGMGGVYREHWSMSESNFDGAFTFSSLQDYLDGNPLNFRMTSGEPLLQADQWELAFFMQNDLRLTSQLTFMFGVRYERQTNVNDNNNVAPRLAFAYSPGRSTVIRVGGGIFYQSINFGDVQTQMRQDGRRQHEIVIDRPSFPDPFQAGTVREIYPSIRVTDPTLVVPYNATATVSFERTFLNNLLFTASFDYSRNVHRYRARNLNAPYDAGAAEFPTSCTTATPAAQCVRPNPEEGDILSMESSGNGLNRTLRLNIRHRFSILNVTASYTRNWSMDDGQPNNIFNMPTDNYNLGSDWSRTPNARHNFNATVNARLPLGLFLTGRLQKQADTAYTVTTGRDDNRDGVVNDRPAGVGRFTERGPGAFQADFNISKAFFLGAGNGGTQPNINVFANMTNAFNTPQLGRPSGVQTSPNFGKSTNASNPREIEAGIRFQF